MIPLLYMSQIQEYTALAKEKTKTGTESTKRPTSVDIIKPEINKKISALADVKGTSTRRFVNDLLEMYIEKEEFISRYIPQLKKIGFDEDLGEIYLRDSQISKSPTVSKTSDGFIKCDTCKKDVQDSCVHVMYAMTQPEIGRLHLARKKK